MFYLIFDIFLSVKKNIAVNNSIYINRLENAPTRHHCMVLLAPMIFWLPFHAKEAAFAHRAIPRRTVETAADLLDHFFLKSPERCLTAPAFYW